jgi:hypothetical protein
MLRVNKANAKAFEPKASCILAHSLVSFLFLYYRNSSKTTDTIFHDQVSEPTS